MFRMDMGLCIGITLWPVLKSLFRIRHLGLPEIWTVAHMTTAGAWPLGGGGRR